MEERILCPYNVLGAGTICNEGKPYLKESDERPNIMCDGWVVMGGVLTWNGKDLVPHPSFCRRSWKMFPLPRPEE